MSRQRYLVLGATGTVGRRVTDKLRARGVEVAAASRSGAVRFDWQDPATWEAAISGCTRAFVMAPDGVEVNPEFLDSAVEGGVARLVLLSSKAIDVMSDERLLSAEAAVKASGAEWTIVRADWFNQNFDEGVLRDSVLANEVVIPLGSTRQAFNDAEDIAAVVAAALTGDGHESHTYELTGPDALTFEEAADIISRASDRAVRYLGTADDYIRVMTGFGIPLEEVRQQVAAFEALRATGDAQVNDTVERVTGCPPTSFHTYAAEAAARGAWRADQAPSG